MWRHATACALRGVVSVACAHHSVSDWCCPLCMFAVVFVYVCSTLHRMCHQRTSKLVMTAVEGEVRPSRQTATSTSCHQMSAAILGPSCDVCDTFEVEGLCIVWIRCECFQQMNAATQRCDAGGVG